MIHVRNIMGLSDGGKYMGDIMNIMEDVQYNGVYLDSCGVYHEYIMDVQKIAVIS